MRTVLISIFILLNSLVFSKNLTIKNSNNGIYNNSCIYKLYRYNNIFNKTYLKDINNENNYSYYEATSEPDAYMITNSVDKRFIIFIWDGDIVIEVDPTEFDDSIVKNSPLTLQYDSFLEKRNEIFLKPLWKLDSLKDAWRSGKHHTSIQFDSLNFVFNKLFEINKTEFRKYTQKYISENTDSFISLLLLTLYGGEADYLENKLLFDKLTSRLKSHPRAILYE